jgi:hypothetical protein
MSANLVRYFAVYDHELRQAVYCSRNYFHAVAALLMLENKRNLTFDKSFRYELEDCVFVPTAAMLPLFPSSSS